jgi:Domain of unknown function (DUF5655)/Domain of unknown function (DUF4287)
MSSLDKATATQIENIQKKTGKSLDELRAIITASGLAKHGEIRDMLKRELGLGHGDANTLTHVAMKSDGASAAAAKDLSTDDVLAEIYSGAKEALRPIHDRIMERVAQFGEFEIAPKKGYVSLRRKKQFAMIGPTTKTRVDVGLNMKGVEGTDRLAALPAGGMCSHNVRLTSPDEADEELFGWIRTAFDAAG